MTSRQKIVVATADTLARRMAGPAIRAWQIAAALSAEHEVKLVTTGSAELFDPRFEVRAVEDKDLKELIKWCDVMVFQGWVLAGRTFLRDSTKVLVADIYDPMHLEQLEQGRDKSEIVRAPAVSNANAVLNEQMVRADYLLCASPKQRDFWLGQLAALGRINPMTYDEEASLRSLLAIVPFGVGDDPPVKTGAAIKGVIPGIGADDKVVLWGGGVYNWFDPLTLVRAVDDLKNDVPNVRLVFMGLRHPNPEIPEMRMAVATRRLADELGLAGSHVFFNEDWVPYDERQNHLLEADVGVSTHFDHVETEFSFRTRILDYLWCRLPVVTTGGDALGDLVEEYGLGLTVPPDDVGALRDALHRVLTDDEFAAACRTHIDEVVPALQWSSVLEPLLEFCRNPRRAPDLVDEEQKALVGMRVGIRRHGLRDDLTLLGRYLRQGGPVLVAKRLSRRARRKLGMQVPEEDLEDS